MTNAAKFRTLLNRETVAVDVLEVIAFALDEGGSNLLSMVLVNPSGTETINGSLLAGDGTSYGTEPWDGLASVGPGEVRRVQADISGIRAFKIALTASGPVNAILSVYTQRHP